MAFELASTLNEFSVNRLELIGRRAMAMTVAAARRATIFLLLRYDLNLMGGAHCLTLGQEALVLVASSDHFGVFAELGLGITIEFHGQC